MYHYVLDLRMLKYVINDLESKFLFSGAHNQSPEGRRAVADREAQGAAQALRHASRRGGAAAARRAEAALAAGVRQRHLDGPPQGRATRAAQG